MQRIRLATTLALVCLVSFLSPSSSSRAASPDIVISQVYGAGGNSGAIYRNDFIELYNRGTVPASLSGLSLQYASATGTGAFGSSATQLTELPAVTLEPGQYFLVQEAGNAAVGAVLPAPDVVDGSPIAMAAGAGKVALVTGTTGLGCNGGSTLCTPAQLARIKDLVGYGNANFFEGAAAAPTLSASLAAFRKNDGARDTDDNAADFTSGLPNPRNSGIVVPPPPEPVSAAIHSVQGAGVESPFVGQLVATHGIVTALKTNGFFLQAADAEVDADPATSEAVFVFTSTAPAVTAGADVLVTGTVREFFNLTEIDATAVTTTSSGNPLPAPVVLTPDILNPAGTSDQLERFEGMRLHADTLVSVAATNRFGEIETVLGGVSRPMREPGIGLSLVVPPDPVTGSVDCCIPRWDENLERIMIDSDGLAGMGVVTVTANVTFTNVTGPLDFSFSRYKLVPETLAPASANMTAVAVPVPGANEFTVAGYNIENFANNTTQRRKAALAIRDVMRLPDVIGTIEIANLATLEALAAEVNGLAVDAGESNPLYEAHLIPASETATQNVGFLVKGSRVRVDEVAQVGAGETFINPGDGLEYLLHDRPPLVLRATLNPAGASPEKIIVVVNHPRSFIDIELVVGDGIRVRQKRTKQAESIAALLQQLQSDNPKTPVIAVGDYNAFQFNDGYTDPVSIIKGTPTAGDQIVVAESPDLVNPDFVNLTDALPAVQRYSFVFDGTAQAIDHVFINTVAQRIFQRYAVARSNADFPETAEYVNDATRPERSSDHDMPVAYFAFPGTPVVTLEGGATMTIEAYGAPFVDPGATAKDETGPLTVTVSGAVDVNTPGEYTLSYTASNFFHTTTITRTVIVADTTGPSIANFAVTPDLLWPPDHGMTDIVASYTASDASQSVACSIEVTSNEAVNGLGDGDTNVDWNVLSATALQLRAERSGRGTARVYTVALSCEDNAGNRTVQTLPVTVPRNR